MKIIGLCGGSGSGKGAVSKIFLEYCIPSIDTDALYHDITSKKSACVDELVSVFGDDILDSNGGVNRRILSQIVFAKKSADKLNILNQISHRHILNKTREIINDYDREGIGAVIVDAPLLFESGFDSECDFTVAVVADRDLRLKRIVKRDGITNEAAARRIDAQMPDDVLIEKCDFVIENNGDVQSLYAKVNAVVSKINL